MDSKTAKIAFIPIRKGSKGIPGKNLRPLLGRPLVCWILDTIIQSKTFDEIYVATDWDDADGIIESRYGSAVRIFKRSDASATDNCNVGKVVQEFIDFRKPSDEDVFVLFQATSPFTSVRDINSVMSALSMDGVDSALACSRLKRFRWTDDGVSLDYTSFKPMRQQYKGFLVECGAFYASRIKNIITHIGDNYIFSLGGHVKPIEVSERTAIDLDEEIDWMIAEYYAKKEIDN